MHTLAPPAVGRTDDAEFRVAELPGHIIKITFGTSLKSVTALVNKATARDFANKLLFSIRAGLMESPARRSKGGAA